MNQLKQGFLYLRHLSGARHPSIQRTPLSTDLQRMLLDIIRDGQFSEDDYQALDDSEKHLFDKLLTVSKADTVNGIKLYRHEKITDKQRNADIKRFQILRGELLAGQNSPEVIKELKTLTLKLMEERVLTKTEYNQIMRYIFALT